MKRSISRIAFYALIVFIFMSLQLSNVLAVFEINPDIILILAILHALNYGEYNGVLFGFGVGLVEDTLSGTLFGMNSFVVTLISYLTSVYKKYIFISDIIAFLIYVVLATILKYILFTVLIGLFQKTAFFNGYVFLKLCGEIAYNIIVGLILFYAAPLLYRRSENPF